jgi:DNA-binding CsgD family transcriptional regulator
LGGWVGSEIAWLDGDVATAAARAEALLGTDLAGTLATITDWWSTGKPVELAGLPEPAVLALTAAQSGDFVAAAQAWDGISLRERVRALLGADDADSLLLAERLADEAGLAVLLGRIRRALRRHGVVRRPTESSSAGLSPREFEVMALVAAGQSSRRIADRLGLTTNTVETYVRSAMGKLGARTRTEAAVRAGELAMHR